MSLRVSQWAIVYKRRIESVKDTTERAQTLRSWLYSEGHNPFTTSEAVNREPWSVVLKRFASSSASTYREGSQHCNAMATPSDPFELKHARDIANQMCRGTPHVCANWSGTSISVPRVPRFGALLDDPPRWSNRAGRVLILTRIL